MLADAAAVEVALDPIRASILDALTEPGSATTVAAAVGSTRQKVNYHLKALEAHGLVELAEERVWGGITERVVRRSARHLVVAPDVLQGTALDPNEVADRLSAAYLIAVNARTVSEVGAIARNAATGTRLPTLTVDTVIGFESPEDRAAFAADLQSSGRGPGRPLPPRRRATAPSDRFVLPPTRGALVTNPDQPDRVEHRMERTYEVAATPEEVWDAIATADGISAWMVPTRLDPQVGGAVSFDVGFWSHGIVTDYTPGRRFAYAEPWPTTEHDLSSVTPIATEFLIESASGGSCVVRVVTSAYGSGADWENEFFAEMIDGVIPMLDNLATYLNDARS